MQEPGKAERKINIPYFEGVNSLVSFVVASKTELAHAENMRSKKVGEIEKREGQVVLGKNTSNQPFITSNNYGLFSFENNQKKGFYRISVNENSTLSINVRDQLKIEDKRAIDDSTSLDNISVVTDKLLLSEYVNVFINDSVTIYSLNDSSQWVPLTGNGANISTIDKFSVAYAEGCAFLANKTSANRYIKDDGTTVMTSSDTGGHLSSCPNANLINFYKNRLYVADFIRSNVNYKTTILRSSYPMGIMALVNADYDPANPLVLKVTDTKYFSGASGDNSYDIYRGSTLVTTITVTVINELDIHISTPTIANVLTSDEIWITGTYTGSKIFRWARNPTTTGRDVKQYDTFKLAGGENDAVTMMTNVGNIMILSNKTSMASWNDYVLENFDMGVGCVSKKGYIKVLGTLYFLHYTGVYATTGGAPQLISSKAERYINGATTTGKEACAAGKKGRSVFFTLGDVTLYNGDGSIEKVMNNVCLEYNIIQQNWFVHTNVKADEFTTFVEATNSDRLEFTDTDGSKSVKEFLVENVAMDDGKEISARMDTQLLTMQSDFEHFNSPIAIITEVARGSGMQIFAKLDKENSFYPLEGKVTKGLSITKVTNKDNDRGKPPMCRLISLSIRDSTNQICKISRMSIVYLPTTDEPSDNET